MKKPEIDLSKEGMSKFFLHHTEKVILAVAIAALGYLCWNGWSTEKYTKTEPKKLSDLATRAKQHIDKGDSWTKIEKFRVADDTAHIRIEEAKNRQLDPSKYAIGRLLGTKAASLGLRPDPELVRAEDLVAVSYRAPILLKMREGYEAALAKLPLATAAEADNRNDEDDRRGSLGGSGEIGSEGDSSSDRNKRDENKDEFGDTIPPVMEQELVGIRPKGAAGDIDYDPIVVDGVAVTGLVNFDAQFKKYEAAFKQSIGYYPLRDRPLYVYLEVQRREVGTEEWKDISEQFVDDQYGGDRAPEIIDPLSYDSVLTRDIPPIVNYDYRRLARHEKIGLRKLVPSALAKRKEVKKGDSSDVGPIFDTNFENETNANRNNDRERDGGNRGVNRDKSKDNSNEDDFDIMKGSSRAIYDAINPLATPKTEYKLIRFFDYRADAGKTYQYRVRLWLNDPNDQEGFTKAGEKGRRNGIDDRLKGSSMDMTAGGEGEKNDGDEDNEIAELAKYPYVQVNKNLQQQEVRSRIREKRSTDKVPNLVLLGKKDTKENAEALDDLLSVAWATEWSEPTPPVTVGSNTADFYAGDVIRPSVIRYGDKVNGDKVFPRDEPSAKLVTSLWSKRYNTAIPSLKAVRRGDVLNYSVPKAHILHPAEGSVRRLKDAEIETDAVVVDLMGGDNVPGRFKFPVKLPSEVLVMDGSGKLRLQNSEDDLRGYRHSLFLPDEGSEYGKARRKKDDDNGRDGDGGLPDF